MNVNEIITEKIVKRIETAISNGENFHWVKPWRGGCNQPISYITKKAYTGINRLILDPGMYITFNALQDYRKTQPEDKEIYIKRVQQNIQSFSIVVMRPRIISLILL